MGVARLHEVLAAVLVDKKRKACPTIATDEPSVEEMEQYRQRMSRWAKDVLAATEDGFS